MKKIWVVLCWSVWSLEAAPIADELVQLHSVSTIEMNAITIPAQGSLVFNTDDKEVYERNTTSWNRISSDGSETKIVAGNGIKINGSGTTLDPYVFSIIAPVSDCSAGAQAVSCATVGAVDGSYCIDSDGTGANAPYMVYCDMSTDGGGWARVVRTTGNNHQFGQKNDSIVYAAVTDNIGIYETYDKIKNFSKVMLKKVGTVDYSSYDLVSTVVGESIYDLMTFTKNQTVQVQNDIVFDGVRVKGLTSEYSGQKTSGTLNYNYFFMAGINESSDNDQAYMSFSDSTGSSNTWGDAWRGVNQRGTVWSLQNGDYYTPSNTHIGNNYSQAGAGYKGNNNGTYEVYIK